MIGATLHSVGSVVLGNRNYPDEDHLGNVVFAGVVRGRRSIGANRQSPATVIWPNPVLNEIFLDVESKGSIFNILGQKILIFNSEISQTIDVSQLASGVCFLKPESKTAAKFIKS